MIRTGSLFSQILSLFQHPDFARHVRELKTEYRAKGFISWEQFVAMLFCQLAQARSLRDISNGLKSCEGKLQHLGLVQEPKRSTLSYANAHRPWELFERLFYDLLAQCQAIIRHKHRYALEDVFKTRYDYSRSGAIFLRQSRKDPLMFFMFYGRLAQLFIKTVQYKLTGKKELAYSFSSDLRGFIEGWKLHRKFEKENLAAARAASHSPVG